jgi:hypothetical protein
MISYLPDFLDEMRIIFIYKQAKINLELNTLEIKLKNLKMN